MHKVKKNKFLSNKTSLEGSRNIKKIFMSSTQLTEQRELCTYSGVFSLSYRVIKNKFINMVYKNCVFI